MVIVIKVMKVGVGYKSVIFGNPRSKSLNERGLSSEHFGTNIKAFGQKLSRRKPKTYHRGGFLTVTENRAWNYGFCSNFGNYKDMAGSTVFQYLISQTLSIHIILMCACMYFFLVFFIEKSENKKRNRIKLFFPPTVVFVLIKNRWSVVWKGTDAISFCFHAEIGVWETHYKKPSNRLLIPFEWYIVC